MTLTPEQRQKLRGMLNEASDSLLRQSAERDLLKDIKSRMKEEFEIETKTASALIRIHHEGNLNQFKETHETIETLYEVIMGACSNI